MYNANYGILKEDSEEKSLSLFAEVMIKSEDNDENLKEIVDTDLPEYIKKNEEMKLVSVSNERYHKEYFFHGENKILKISSKVAVGSWGFDLSLETKSFAGNLESMFDLDSFEDFVKTGHVKGK